MNMDPIFSELPLPLVARCVAFNVETAVDIAKLRLVNKAFGRAVKGFLPSIGERRGHSIQCPGKAIQSDAFVAEVLDKYDPDGAVDSYQLCPGEVYDIAGLEWDVLENCDARELSAVEGHTTVEDFERKTANPFANAKERMEKLVQVCQALSNVSTVETLKTIAAEIRTLGLMEPDPFTPGNSPKEVDSTLQGREELGIYPSLLMLMIPHDSNDILDTIVLENGTKVLKLRTIKTTEDEEIDDKIRALHLDSVYHAPVLSSEGGYLVQILIDVLAHEDTMMECVVFDGEVKRNTILDTICRHHQEKPTVEGVVVVDDALGSDLQTQLNKHVQDLADWQDQQGSRDYHPNSHDVVRDLVHPGLYSYVEGVSPLRTNVEESPCIFPTASVELKQVPGKDFWGRAHETSKYQWLPTYFNISMDGRCTIEDYINNLSPRDSPVFSPLYDSLSRLFEQSLPYMESVYSYVHAVRQQLREDEEVDYDADALKALEMEHLPLRGQRLQVITKIVDYELKPEQRHVGVWHVEGMSHEEIVMTALYILDRDEEIEGGELAFKRAILEDEACYIFSSVPQSRPQSLETIIHDGLVPLGRVETRKGRLIVFPNSHVHKVGEMVNKLQADGGQLSKRRIVVFFIVNPLRRIVSTREVAPQQGTMTLEDALGHRLELMKERKYKKQDWNVREIELCEH